MKYKITGLLASILILILAALAILMPQKDLFRYHQHLEAQEKLPCSHSEDVFCTHLPLIQINSTDIKVPGDLLLDDGGIRAGTTVPYQGKQKSLFKIVIIDHEETNNHITDSPDIETNAYIRFGNDTSETWDNQAYVITLIDESGAYNTLPIMGMQDHYEWVLYRPSADQSLIRNYMWYNLSGEIMSYAPNIRFCELIMDGEYLGVHLMTESVTAGDDGARLPLTTDLKYNTEPGYLLLFDNSCDSTLGNIRPFSMYTYRTFTESVIIKFPDERDLTEEIAESIRQDFSEFERSLYSFDYDSPKYGFRRAINIDSFINYYLINEIVCNQKTTFLSTYIYKDNKGFYNMCVWDFSDSMDNQQGKKINTEILHIHGVVWYFMLTKEKKFVEQTIHTYKNLRKNILSGEYIENYIDDVVCYLGPAIDRNNAKWGTHVTIIDPASESQEPILRSYEESILQIKDFLKNRTNWLDENIESMRQLYAVSKNKLYNKHTR